MLALSALICAALFAGAASYVSFAEHPARMSLDDRNSLAQWKLAYTRGAILQAGLALIGGTLGALAWWRWQSNWFWLAGGLTLLADIPFTFAILRSTDTRLNAIPIDQAGPESHVLLTRWARLHSGRTALGLAAMLLIARGLLP